MTLVCVHQPEIPQIFSNYRTILTLKVPANAVTVINFRVASILFHCDFIQVQAKYNIHRARPCPSSHSRQMAGQDTEYEQNAGDIYNKFTIYYVHYIVDKLEIT